MEGNRRSSHPAAEGVEGARRHAAQAERTAVAALQGRQDRQKLKRAYDAIKAELQNYENNIGFLTAASKKGNSLIDQTQKKIESLKKDLEQIAQKLKES